MPWNHLRIPGVVEVSSLDQLRREEYFLMAYDLNLSLPRSHARLLLLVFCLLLDRLTYHVCLKLNPTKSFVVVGCQGELGNLKLWWV